MKFAQPLCNVTKTGADIALGATFFQTIFREKTDISRR